jgi:hypothetical protein
MLACACYLGAALKLEVISIAKCPACQCFSYIWWGTAIGPLWVPISSPAGARVMRGRTWIHTVRRRTERSRYDSLRSSMFPLVLRAGGRGKTFDEVLSRHDFSYGQAPRNAASKRCARE